MGEIFMLVNITEYWHYYFSIAWEKSYISIQEMLITIFQPQLLYFQIVKCFSHFTKRIKIRSNPLLWIFSAICTTQFCPHIVNRVHAAVTDFTLSSVCYPHAMPAASWIKILSHHLIQTFSANILIADCLHHFISIDPLPPLATLLNLNDETSSSKHVGHCERQQRNSSKMNLLILTLHISRNMKIKWIPPYPFCLYLK